MAFPVMVLLLAFAFTRIFMPAFPPAADIMLVGAAMALHAIGEVADSFFDMLRSDVRRCVLMASVASIPAVIVAGVASHAAGVMVAIEGEELFMVEACRHPLRLLMTLSAVTLDLLVHAILGRLMAGLAPFARRRLEQ